MNQTFCFPTSKHRYKYPQRNFLGDSTLCFQPRPSLVKGKQLLQQRSFERIKHFSKKPKYDKHATAVVET